MVRKEVNKQETLREDPIVDDSEVEGDELFEGLESMTPD